MQGTGALYALPAADGHDVHTFMTCNHVISSTDAEELSSMSLEFRVKSLGTVYFPRNWVLKQLHVVVMVLHNFSLIITIDQFQLTSFNKYAIKCFVLFRYSE